jgi:hypothetical protein
MSRLLDQPLSAATHAPRPSTWPLSIPTGAQGPLAGGSAPKTPNPSSRERLIDPGPGTQRYTRHAPCGAFHVHQQPQGFQSQNPKPKTKNQNPSVFPRFFFGQAPPGDGIKPATPKALVHVHRSATLLRGLPVHTLLHRWHSRKIPNRA